MNAKQRAEFESMLIGEAIRRLRRELPRDTRKWPLYAQMTKVERVLVAFLAAPYRVRDWLRRKMRP